MSKSIRKLSRRSVLKTLGIGLAATSSMFPPKFSIGAQAKLKIGTLLPYSGTYARLGEAITNAMELAFNEVGGKLGGREIEIVKIDSEAKPPKATENTTKLVASEKVDFIVGPVHSGVAMAMAKIVREEGTMTVVPNAGANQVTGAFCAPNIFRTSFSNWQPGHPMGKVLLEKGLKNIVLAYWDYGAGKQSAQGFKDGFVPFGGSIIKEIGIPFPKVEFQAVLTEIGSIKPDAVYIFVAGGGAVKFVKDWAAAGLKDKIVLTGPGFLTEGTTKAQGQAAEGIQTTLHYADTLENSKNKAFRAAYRSSFDKDANVYAVQGYDAGQLIRTGVDSVGGDTGARADLIKAMENATIDSPRGSFTLSAAHNPIQDFYLREVKSGVNTVVKVAQKALADPATGCKMS